MTNNGVLVSVTDMQNVLFWLVSTFYQNFQVCYLTSGGLWSTNQLDYFSELQHQLSDIIVHLVVNLVPNKDR